jgi:hypothetical protein
VLQWLSFAATLSPADDRGIAGRRLLALVGDLSRNPAVSGDGSARVAWPHVMTCADRFRAAVSNFAFTSAGDLH